MSPDDRTKAPYASAVETHENGLALFVIPAKRARFRESLGSPRRRKKLLGQLDHFDHLDEKWATEAPLGSPDDVAANLRSRGAPETCHVVSSDEDLDGRELPLLAALAAIEQGYSGTFVSCVPGRLAYFRSEPPSRGLILQRPAE
jgi:hypothetical protein